MRIDPASGEIQFQGRTVFSGYWNAPELTAQAFTDDGWYQTGDLGRLDPQGRLILSGRIKDIIVLPNGFNVYPEDIENALRIAGLRDTVVVETRAGSDRGGRPPGSRGGGPSRGPRPHRCRGQGRQREPRPEPADRRLARLADGGLPADPHAQDQARPGPSLGGHGRAAPRVGRRRRGRRDARRRVLARDRDPDPDGSRASAMRGIRSSGDEPGIHE